MSGPFMEPEDAMLDFEQTLGELQGLLGAEVEVTAGAGDGVPTLATTFAGVLRRSSDLTINPNRREQEAQFFLVSSTDDAPTGFLVHAGSFRGGQPTGDGVRYLAGPILVTVRRVT